MASVLLPILAKDDVGAAYVPRASRMHASASDLLIVVKDGPMQRYVAAALKEYNVPLLNVVPGKGATVCIVRPPADLRASELWQRLGIPSRNLAEPDRSVDLADAATLTRRFKECLRGAGLSELETPRRIGLNLAGSVVYETVGGRVAVNTDGVAHYEYDRFADGREKGVYRDRFLRARTPDDLRGCAEGVARAIATGENFNRGTLSALHGEIVSDSTSFVGEPPDAALSMFLFQEEIEAALVVQAARLTEQGVGLREVARVLTDMAATHGERTAQRLRLQQYSTPLPIGAVAADILRFQPGEVVLEPSVGNGALAIGAAIAGARIEAFEVDPERAARAERTLRTVGATAVTVRPRAFPNRGADAPGLGVDVVLANPPFEGVGQTIETDRHGRKLAISRLDHRIVYDALEDLRDTGRAFLVLPGEMMGEGKLEGAQANFNRYLHATFEVAGAAVLDGRLYRKSGAQFPVIVYALGPRLESPLAEAAARNIPDDLPYLRTTDELFAWGDAAAASMQSIMVRRGVWSPEDISGKVTVGAASTPNAGEQPSGEISRRYQPRPRRWYPRRQEDAPARAAVPRNTPRSPGQTGEVVVPEEASAPPLVSVQMPAELSEEESFAVSPEVLIDDIVIDNDPFQVTYEAASRVGGPSLKIQKALAAPVAEAMAELERIRGPIDAFVAEALGVTEAELGGLLHAGQVDGVGLGLHKALRAESVIVGDLMGVGKGRQLAALTRAALKEERPVVFFTDNAALFTDFVARDVATVLRCRPSELGQYIKPYIMNSSADASIIDPEFEGVRRGAHGYVFKAGAAGAKKDRVIDGSVNMVLSSYSQLGAVGREAKLEAIIAWLDKQDRPPLLIMDESHKAAGEGSHVGAALTALVDHVTLKEGSVAYSSGTALKGARNLKVYGSALPDVGIPTDKLVELIEKEPLALQEALSFEMARAGALIARELDNSDVRRETVSLQDIDPNRYAQVLEKVDLFADKMAELLALGREVKAWSKEREKQLENLIKETVRNDGERGRALATVGVHYQSPASRFHHLSNYLTLAINGVFLEDMVLHSISEGRKPVIAVANTGDALLRDLISQHIETEVAGDGDVVAVSGGEARMPEKPHLGHVVKRMADRLLTVKEANGFGVTVETRLEEYEGWLVDFERRVDADDFSMLSLSVIDDLSAALEKHGLSMGEITGRAYTIRQAEDGNGYIASSRAKPLKQDVVSAFNNGRTDVLLLNQSAAVGLSAHSSPAIGFDVRPREMIKAQMQADVAQERQMDGRINRVGQLFAPLYTIPQQGLASSDRLAQLFNRKNRSLTATSTATRENESNISEALDLLNEVGQFVSYGYLANNPDIAELLDINIEIEVDPEHVRSGFSEKLMGRMIALPTSMQRAIMSELDTAFQMRVGFLDALGENPLRLREYDWKAEVEQVRQLITGDATSERMSERPLVLNKIIYQETVKPLGMAELDMAVERGERRMVDEVTARRMTVVERLEDLAPGNMGMGVSFADPIFDRVMNRAADLRSLGATEHDVAKAAEIWSRRDAIEAAGDAKGLEKMVVEAGRKVAFLADIVPLLEPGAIVAVNPAAVGRLRDSTLFQAAVDYIEGTSYADGPIAVPAVVTGVRFSEEKALNLGEWDIRLAVPGQEMLIEVPLASAFAVTEELRKKGEDGWLFSAATHDDNALGLAGAIAPMWSPLLAEAIEKTAPAADTPDRSVLQVAKMADGSVEAERMQALFETVAGGKVTRSRYAVEGNLFAAVSALAGKRMGEKAMYTDSAGTIRHCYLLKRDEHKKVLEKLGSSVAGRVSYIKADRASLADTLLAFGGLVGGMGGPSVEKSKRATEQFFPALVDDFKRRIEAMDHSVDIEALRTALLPRLGELHGELIKAVREQGVVNTGLFVGSEPFGDAAEKGFRTACAVRVREGKSDAESTFMAYYEPVAVSALAGSLSDSGALAAFDAGRYGLIVKAKNAVCDKNKNGMAANWTNRGIEGSTLRHAAVGAMTNNANTVAEFLCAASADQRNEGMIGLKGALVVYNDLAQLVSRQLIPEVSVARDIRGKAATAVEARSEPKWRQAPTVSPGM